MACEYAGAAKWPPRRSLTCTNIIENMMAPFDASVATSGLARRTHGAALGRRMRCRRPPKASAD